ncbi:MAG TPA: hypothetical protein PLW35_11385, partial [Verrucomicrobiota bacterium]|nr:hypothetical protein [Verrucomicrobiota bacterium]
MRLATFDLIVCVAGLLTAAECSAATPVPDMPFRQPITVRFTTEAELEGATFQKMCLDRDGVVYMLTDRGIARNFDTRIAIDKSYRPLAGKRALDIALRAGRLYYLFEDRLLSNESAGKPLVELPAGAYRHA